MDNKNTVTGMDVTEATVLSMTRAGLLGEKCSIDPQTDWSKLFSIAYRQGIINIIYRSLKHSDTGIPEDFLRLFQVEALRNIRTDYQQRSELKSLFESFEEAGIRYLPIKGILIKNLYPRPELRWMSDADIIIEKNSLEQVCPLMEKLGYAFKKGAPYEQTWEKDDFQVDVHSSALSRSYSFYEDYFADPFALANHTEGMCYQFGGYDMLLYSICHLAKHYLDDFGNLRNVIDLYYLLQDPSLNMKHVEQVLKEWRMDGFFEILRKTVTDWFSGAEMGEKSRLLLGHILKNSEKNTEYKVFALRLVKFGNKENRRLKGLRFRYFFASLFPPLREMRLAYPLLERVPFLLPFFWFRRILFGLFFNWDHVRRFADASFRDSEAVVKHYMEEAEAVGLLDMAMQGMHG